MIKGKYVAQIEIDILVDENTPSVPADPAAVGALSVGKY
jgi:hypothetical protein